jgi:hypothetical protein
MGWIFLVTSLEYIYVSARSLPYVLQVDSAVPFLLKLFDAPTYSAKGSLPSGRSCNHDPLDSDTYCRS